MSQNYLTQPFVRTLSGESMPRETPQMSPPRDSLVALFRKLSEWWCEEHVMSNQMASGVRVTIDMQDEIRTVTW